MNTTNKQDSVAVLLGKLRCIGTLLQQLDAQPAARAVNEAVELLQSLATASTEAQRRFRGIGELERTGYLPAGTAAEREQTSPDARREGTCHKCGAPCRKEVLMRGGDNGWGDDASRTVYRYVPPSAVSAASTGGGAITMRELTQALTQHYKETSGDDRHVPATITAVETVRSLLHIIEGIRRDTEAAPGEGNGNG